MRLRNRLAPTRVAIFCALVLGSQPAWAQTSTAELVGTVSDPNGRLIVDASIILTNVDTKVVRSAIYGGSGIYTLTSVPPGKYTLDATAKGFAQKRIEGIVLQVDQRTRLDLTLSLATVSETVEVTSDTPLLNTEDATVGSMIPEKAILQLPLNGRNFTQMIGLVPGVTAGSDVGVGIPDAANRINIDGANDIEPFTGGISVTPIVDTLQEFRVQVGTYSSEYGLGGALVVDAVTRSGSNTFHGDAWDFYRNKALDAPPFFARTVGTEKIKTPLIRNQFGLTGGGPIVKNRAFFFAGFEGLKLPGGTNFSGNLPTSDERNGNFSQYSKTIIDPFTKTPFPNNIIPTNRLDPVSLKMANTLFANPDNDNPSRDWVISQPNNMNQYSESGRIDYYINGKNSLFGRFNHQQSTTDAVGSYSTGIPSGYGDAITTFRGINGAVGLTSTVTPTLVNTFTLSYNRSLPYLSSPETALDSFGGCLGFGLQAPMCRAGFKDGGLVGLTIGSSQFFAGTNPNLVIGAAPPIRSTSATYQLQENLTWTRGTHTWKFGINVQRHLTQSFNDGQPGASFTNAYSNDGFADFLLGLPSGLSDRLDTASTSDLYNMYYAGYVQHDWKVSSKLTLNAGVRYEVATPIIERHGNAAQFDPTLGIDGSKYLVQSGNCANDPRDCGGLIYPSQNTTAYAYYHNIRPDLPYGIMKDKNSIYDMDANNWAPRIGIAWRPFGGNKTVVRAGYGINYYFQPLLNLARFIGSIPPAVVSASILSDPKTPTLTWNSLGQGTTSASTALLATNTSVGRGNLNPYVQQRSVSIAREVGRNTVVELQYVGSKSTHTQMEVDFDTVPCLSGPGASCPGGFGTGTVQSRVPYDKFSQLNGYYYGGFASYNGGIASVRRTVADGLIFQGSYTYSKAMGGGGDGDYGLNPFARQQEKFRTGNDATHSASAFIIWDLPLGRGKRFGSNTHGFANGLIGGWQLSDISVAHSGLPAFLKTTVTFCNNSNLATACVPNRTGSPNDVKALSNGIDSPRYLVSNFPEPSNNYGNSGENIITNDGVWNNDMALNKITSVTERIRVEFRVEAFNVFNHPQFGSGLAANASSPTTFGRVSTAATQRDIQLGLKIHF